MSPALAVPPTPAATDPLVGLGTIGTPALWALTIGGILALLALDLLITRRPRTVSMREALGWSAFYIAIPVAFGAWVWSRHGTELGVEYYTGYLVEKTLSIDNLFVLMLLLSGFAVPKALQQRVLLIGIAGALVLRGLLIALGATLIATFSAAFLVFGLILAVTAVKVLRDARADDHPVSADDHPVVRLARRLLPVTSDYRGPAMTVQENGRRAVTPLLLVVLAVLGTDVIFAIDSVPAVYGITGDPYLVFTTNAFALLGLRALYFVLEGALARLVHLSYGLATILLFIATKLILHWAHGVWAWVPTISTLAGLGGIVAILATVTVTSLWATRSPASETGARGRTDGPGRTGARTRRAPERAEPGA